MNTSFPHKSFSRRQFIATTALALAAPTLLTPRARAAVRRPAPSGRITLGVVGWGMQGPQNTRALMALPDCQVVATCNVDKSHLQQSKGAIDKHYGNSDCLTFHDYREMMAREDIDAVMLAVPDHWHALTATEAARRGKDIYSEKPLARTIAEQQVMVRAVQQAQVIWQTGSWQRSVSNFHKAAEIVRNGLIGKVSRVEVGLPAGHNDIAKTRQYSSVTEPPPELDYETWIGPAKMEPYIKARVHKNWRWNYNTGGGQLMDWVGHHVDIAHWGLGFDLMGPSEVEGKGEFPAPDAVWNTCTKYRIELKYPQDVIMTVVGGHNDIRRGTKWIGSEGWVYVNRGAFDASHEAWTEMKRLPEAQRKTPLEISGNHYRNFLDCVKSRKPTITPIEVAHHSAIPGHLGVISMLVKRKLQWNADTETILNDAEATKLLARAYRSPWKLG